MYLLWIRIFCKIRRLNLKTTTLDNPPRPPSQTAAVSSFPLKIMQSQRCQQLIRGALLLLVSSNAASASSLNNRSESDIVDSNLPRLRGNENILDGHLNAAIKGEEDESVETAAPRLRLCSSTATFSYLSQDRFILYFADVTIKNQDRHPNL